MRDCETAPCAELERRHKVLKVHQEKAGDVPVGGNSAGGAGKKRARPDADLGDSGAPPMLEKATSASPRTGREDELSPHPGAAAQSSRSSM
jgi:hypothetical protein